MPQRRDTGRVAPVAVLAALALGALTALTALAACGGGSAPVSIGPGPGAADGCVFESGTQVCATGTPSGPSPSGPPSGPPSTPAATAPSTTAAGGTPAGSPSRTGPSWGGGRRVGSFRTTGSVHGAQAGTTDVKRLTGTCDVARDVRTVTTKVDPSSTLVIAVTGPNVASVLLRVRGGTTWQVEYVGPAARDVVTLTPTRTRVAGARLLRVSGPAAAPVTLDADFDC